MSLKYTQITENVQILFISISKFHLSRETWEYKENHNSLGILNIFCSVPSFITQLENVYYTISECLLHNQQQSFTRWAIQ